VVATNVGGKFFPRVKKGMKVTIILDQYPERKISGRVLRISPFVDPVSRSAYCEVSMNTSQGITIGSFANLFIHIEEKSRTLLLPRSAIIEDLTAGENSIYAVEANKARKIDIKLGIANEDTVEVLSELPLKTQVVTLGKEYLKEGTLVEIIE
jgi:multidrug efflux pump subunit AcrA (membrane-fusion protein)